MNKTIKIMVLVALTFVLAISGVHAAKDEDKVVSTNTTSTKKEKVNLYMFRQSGCSHCAEELTYLDKIINKYKNKVNIIIYEVNTESNSSLYADVVKELNYDQGGVPITVIGKDYLAGFASLYEDTLIEKIETAYDEQSEDLVAGVLDENVYSKLVSTDLYEAMEDEGLEITSRKTKQNNVLPIVVFSLIAVGLGAFIYYSRKA